MFCLRKHGDRCPVHREKYFLGQYDSLGETNVKEVPEIISQNHEGDGFCVSKSSAWCGSERNKEGIETSWTSTVFLLHSEKHFYLESQVCLGKGRRDKSLKYWTWIFLTRSLNALFLGHKFHQISYVKKLSFFQRLKW